MSSTIASQRPPLAVGRRLARETARHGTNYPTNDRSQATAAVQTLSNRMFGARMLTRIILPICLFCGAASAASADPPLLGNLEAAKSYDYCAWAHEHGADSSLLPDVSGYLVSDTSSVDPRNLPSAIVIDAGMRVAIESTDLRTCQDTLSAGRKLVLSARTLGAKRLRKQAKFKRSENEAIAKAQSEITELWLEDQLARHVYLQTQSNSKSGARHWAHRIATADAVSIDERSAQYLRGLLSEFDWVDIHRFTRPVSERAWILVQHSDDHVDLQKLALERMAVYLESGGVLRSNYAYLWDRIAVNSGELQRYGTQPDWGSCNDGKLTLMPMEDPANVDESRATMQLGPVRDDLDRMSSQTCNTVNGR